MAAESEMGIEMSAEKNVGRLLDRVSLAFVALFATLHSDSTDALCVSAGEGHDVSALQESGVSDVAGVDTIYFHPLFHRGDPTTSPSSTMSLISSSALEQPRRCSWLGSFPQMERTVRRGRAIVLAVDLRSSAQEVEEIKALFKRSILSEGEEYDHARNDADHDEKTWRKGILTQRRKVLRIN